MASSEFFFPSYCGWRLGPFSFPQKKVLFIIPSSLPGGENLQTPRPPKKHWVRLSLHFTGEILPKSKTKI
jgi:hypothetical protein